jgi:Leucine-rich repeat (LRR) protein
MKKLYTLLALVLVSITTTAQIINIPDADFKAKLLAASAANSIAVNGMTPIQIDINNNNEIEISEALQVTSLNVSIANIHDITGIEYFTNLRTLNCNQNHIPSLNVGTLLNLKSLYCSLNLIPTLDLTGLTHLTTLECAENILTQINFANASSLQNISCRFNFLTVLNLSNLNNLQSLNFDYNQLTDINLSNLTQLTDLGCQSNQFSSLDLSALVNLTSLNCSYNQLTALDLTGLNAITTLNCSNNQITSLDLNPLNQLVLLNCEHNQISNPFAFTSLADLQSVYCHNNLIPSITFTDLPSLAVLDCSYNAIASLDVSGLPSLSVLNCHDLTPLAYLNIKNGSNEPFLDFSNNPNLLNVCADGDQIVTVQNLISQYGYTNCQLSSLCNLGTSLNTISSCLKVYPNPVQNSLQLVLNGIQKINSITLYNPLGQGITTIVCNETAATLDVCNLKTGTYFIKVTTDSGSATATFVKE